VVEVLKNVRITAFFLMAHPMLCTALMNVSLYQAASALNAQSRWQEVIAENLASSSIPGFKKQEVTFGAIEGGLMPAGMSGKGVQPFSIPAARTVTSFASGEMKHTGVPTDVAIDGAGFFEVELPNGATAFTRDGEFRINAQGEVITKQGYPVLSTNGRLQVDRNNPNPVSISPTGEISQGLNAVGRIKLVGFSDPQLLQSIGNGLFAADHPDLAPDDAPAATLRQGFVEAANTTPMMEMANLMTSMRTFEANQRVIQIHDERMSRAISELGSPN
jgi:flagellar basal-body rod protein FlgF